MTMTGQDYLKDIRAKLESGRPQRRMGENVLDAFGYVGRIVTAIEEINTTLGELGLAADPPINSEMPLRVPRIHFSLKDGNGGATVEAVDNLEVSDSSSIDAQFQDIQDIGSNLPKPGFSISELASAHCLVECLSPSASIETAYTTMLLHKYSQLVVASSPQPRQQDIKGIVSFQSLAKALMNGNPKTVGDCVDNSPPFAEIDADLKSVVSQLSENDVVLVIGQDKRLRGIVTAWDLAEEFAKLVDPFKRIGEIEERLRVLVKIRLGQDKVAKFLKDHGLLGFDPTTGIGELTMGELQRVLEFPEHWNALKLPFDRAVFISALGEARTYRNRLMHFRGPLIPAEMKRLSNLCDTVREINLYEVDPENWTSS